MHALVPEAQLLLDPPPAELRRAVSAGALLLISLSPDRAAELPAGAVVLTAADLRLRPGRGAAQRAAVQATLGWPEGVALILAAGPDAAVRRIQALLGGELAGVADALLPLVHQESWTAAQGLTHSPGLPATWWTLVRRHLPLIPDGDAVQVPWIVSAALAQRSALVDARSFQSNTVRAADEAIQSGDLRRAERVLRLAGQHEGASDVLAGHCLNLSAAGRRDEVVQLVDAVPAHQRSLRLSLSRLGALAWSKDHARQERAERELYALYEQGTRHPLLTYLLAYAESRAGRYDRSRALCEEGLRITPTGREGLLVLRHYEFVLNRARDFTAQQAACEQLLTLATWEGSLEFTAHAHTGLGTCLEDQGHPDEAMLQYNRALGYLQRLELHLPTIELHNNYAQMLADRGRHAEALHQLTLAGARLVHLDEQAQRRWQAWLTGSRAIILHQGGQHGEALATLQDAVQRFDEVRLVDQATVYRLLLAERLALDGQHGAARSESLRAEGDSQGQGNDDAQLAFTAGVLAYARGDFDPADAAFAAASGSGLPGWDVVRSAAYRAAIALRIRGQLDIQALEDTLSAFGVDAPLITDARQLDPLLSALRSTPLAERIERLLDQSVWQGNVALQVDVAGSLSVRHVGDAVRFPLSRSAELLVYLSLMGPSSRHGLIADLWDGDPSVRAADLLKKAVRGLRDTLRPLMPPGEDPVPYRGARYALNPLLRVRIHGATRSAFPRAVAEFAAVQHVADEFLSGVFSSWVLESRPTVHAALRRSLSAGDAGSVAARLSQVIDSF
ncbi:hypothetical protein CVO96_16500 [Deinococcus koreensis]|uniref:Uncharacterized protein n=1 Tax=Deinococcus koreensis TaxID=2054903 RepID=A0A2K3V1T3_9DEIO|nr:hypothetical protein CVO96_16500 [Deinococcus koreensis]